MFTTKMTRADAQNQIDMLREELSHVGAFMEDNDIRDRLQLHICALMDDCEERIRKLDGAKCVFVLNATKIGKVYEDNELPFQPIATFTTEEGARGYMRSRTGAFEEGIVFTISKKRVGV